MNHRQLLHQDYSYKHLDLYNLNKICNHMNHLHLLLQKSSYKLKDLYIQKFQKRHKPRHHHHHIDHAWAWMGNRGCHWLSCLQLHRGQCAGAEVDGPSPGIIDVGCLSLDGVLGVGLGASRHGVIRPPDDGRQDSA